MLHQRMSCTAKWILLVVVFLGMEHSSMAQKKDAFREARHNLVSEYI